MRRISGKGVRREWHVVKRAFPILILLLILLLLPCNQSITIKIRIKIKREMRPKAHLNHVPFVSGEDLGNFLLQFAHRTMRCTTGRLSQGMWAMLGRHQAKVGSPSARSAKEGLIQA